MSIVLGSAVEKDSIPRPVVLHEDGSDLILFGQIEGEIVFRRGASVYKGKRLLYTDKSGYVGRGVTAGRLIAFIAGGGRIVVLDQEGVIVCDVKRPDYEFVGLDEKRGCMYLLDDSNSRVIRMNLLNQNEEEVFNVNTLAK